MTATRWTVLTALGLALLAGGLRLHRLATWSFAGDELSTFSEVDSLSKAVPGGPAGQAYRLPRMIPVGYALLRVGYDCFGRDEFGSRVLPALMGALCVLLVFLGLDRLMGRPLALTTAVLLSFWPEHLFHSQENRFYVPASLFASLCMLLGAWSVKRRSSLLAALAGLAGLLAVFAHTLLAVLFPGLLFAMVAAARAERQPIPWRQLAVFTACGAATAVLLVCYALPLGLGWNAAVGWGYSVQHSVLAAVNRTGYPVILLACLGGLNALRRRDGLGVFWLTCAGVWGVAAVALPLLMAYHPAYIFALSLGVFALAGYGVAWVYERVRSWDPAMGWAWVAVVCALQLPGVVSHFCDGSRSDFRSAARYIAAHWQPGDQTLVSSDKTLGYYLPEPMKPRSVSMTPESVRQVVAEDGAARFWIVVQTNRAGKFNPVWRSVAPQCALQTVIYQPRLDYFDYSLEVYLLDRAGAQAAARRAARPADPPQPPALTASLGEENR